MYGGAWGPNFLNDGVIRKDFLETGLGTELALAYASDLQPDIDKRLAKEKKYTLYTHPKAPFLGVANVWNYFAPQMNQQFEALKAATDGMEPHAFNTRVQLYLGEGQIPAPLLKNLLRYQEKQSQWITPDEKLQTTDLSLFGYHTLEDWFGPHFVRLVSEFIINASILAESQGYQVSKAEVLTDLIRSTQASYQQSLNNPNLGVTSPEEYFNEQLRRLNMDQAKAIKIWGQVLLFRRYFHDAAGNALVDNLISQGLHNFASENVTVDLYRVPASLKLANFDDLQKFEDYLQAVAKTSSDPLALPQQYLAVAEVEKTYPELVQKHYELEVSQTNQKALQTKIALKELWNWEMEDANWKLLTKQFPTLAVKEAKTREERFEALEGLDPTTRTLVNHFAKKEIVKNHPEWVDEALGSAKPEVMKVGLRSQGGKMPFSGLETKEKRQDFIKRLDEAPESILNQFSADEQNFYRIKVISRGSEPQILSFAEARTDGTLEKVRDRQLEKYYTANRDKNPTLYQNENQEWKPYSAVKELVAQEYYEKLLASLGGVNKTASKDSSKKNLSKDQAASLRFYTHLNKIKGDLEKGSPQVTQWIVVKEEEKEGEKKPKLADQWRVEKKTVTFDRQKGEEGINLSEALALQPKAWSALRTPPNGDLSFYQVISLSSSEADPKAVAEQARQAQFLLGSEAQRHLMKQVIQDLKAKNAISLAYLKVPSDEPAPRQQEVME